MSDIVKNLKEISKLTNLAEEADLSTEQESHETRIEKIGNRVLDGFNKDLHSMEEWLADVKKVEELSTLVSKKKSKPLPNSANIKFPLITKAAYEFSSRTYPEIIKDGKVVKGRVVGQDLTGEHAARCDRVSDYMNYQLLLEQEEWELELDRLLNRIALIGFITKKTYYDPIRKIIRSEICDHHDLIIDCEVKSLEDARRISHIIHFRLNDLIEHVNADLYCEKPVQELIEELGENPEDKVIDIIEQHTFIDLDEDGYAEPYIVTVLKESGKVLRIAPRFDKDDVVSTGDKLKYIDAIQIFTDYHFLVSPKGKFQSVGFGILMLHLNETINSLLNQLVDSGQLANLQGGFKDARLKNMGTGDTLHDPGEWKTLKAMAGVTLKEGLVPVNYKEPSEVLLKLLEMLIAAAKDLSSSTEVMTGGTSADNAKTGAVQALQQASLKVFTSIQRRIYRSLTSEFKKIYRLNSIYADPKKYFTILNQQKFVMKDDFDTKHVHILPVADPNLSSDLQRSSRNQILLALMQLPNTNKEEIVREVIVNSQLNVPPEKLMVPTASIPPSPEMLKVKGELQSWSDDAKLRAEELTIRQFEAKIQAYQAMQQMEKDKAQSLLYLAQAQAQKDMGRIKELELQLDTINSHLDAVKQAAQFMQEGQMHKNEMGMRQQEIDNKRQEIDNNAQADQQQADQGVAGQSS